MDRPSPLTTLCRMVLLNHDLSKTYTGCAKPKCKTGDFVIHRHHKGHQYLFVMAFTSKAGQPRYERFVKRYFEYRPEDIVPLCSSHHRAIHEIYEEIITAHCKSYHRPPRLWTWGMAEVLMGDLIARCNKWLQRPSRGAEPWPSNGQTKRRAEDYQVFMALLKQQDEVPF